MIFFAEIPPHSKLCFTCRRRQRALIRIHEHKINARTCLLYPLPRRFHRYVFRVFHFFLPSSLKFERADFPLLSLKPEEDFLRARIKERKKKGGGVLCSMMRWVSKRRGVQNARGKYVFVRIRTRSFRLKPTSS